MSKEIRTIDASIARLTDALLSDYQQGRAIARMEPIRHLEYGRRRSHLDCGCR